MDPKQIIVWAQVGSQMVQLVATSVESVKSILEASGASKEEQDATLKRTHALYGVAIAHEERIAKG